MVSLSLTEIRAEISLATDQSHEFTTSMLNQFSITLSSEGNQSTSYLWPTNHFVIPA